MKEIKKKGYITIRDSHYFGVGKANSLTETRNLCDVCIKPDSIEVSYVESISETGECYTTLIFAKDRVTMIRTGPISATMIFEKNKRHVSVYTADNMSMMIGVTAKELFIDMNESGGTSSFTYIIDNAGSFVGETNLKMMLEIGE